MKDYLVKAITNDGMFRAYAITSQQMVSDAQIKHDTWSASSAALGRTMIGSALLASSVDKNGAALTVKINGGGPVGQILVDADSNGHVKGYIGEPHVHLPLNKFHKIDVSKAVGVNGGLEVTKILENGDPYTSSVPLASGEIGDDFTYYMAQSEQIPSAVGVSVFVNDDNSIGAAGGYLVQVLPGASDEAIDNLTNRIKELPMLSELLLQNQSPEDILNLLFGEGNLKFLTTENVEFYCNCSKEKFRNDLVGIPVDQLKEILDEDGKIDVVCNFCQSKYHYDKSELEGIIAEAESRNSN
ncbi:Hsp33 family molecular chaperone HslO [Lentilactobacillus sp. SPB1-3]|uniref:Hsp33 family molecular chaperone HslO n=1 Tax=Lentilactobacillus terminaliae TaxID=3003483 RepID=A0ACD5DHF2_9LACO|nr:Hsp33 family molecular chaperone HslO [Lentilactobacillus sp. SPB1-3]MCZ0977903.1 Hsp33 family molecular chaperone HslO [Lentilactobacillus sp. SPB1-3]